MEPMAGQTISAVFVDLENAAQARPDARFDIGQLMERVRGQTRPILRKAYGDWGRFASFRHDFLKEAFDQTQLFGLGASGKNGLDIQLSLDALEALFLFPNIEVVVLVTGDSDFCPLVRMLRRHGRKVIGVGWRHSTSRAFRDHCDEFWEYEGLVGLEAHRPISRGEVAADPTLRHLIDGCVARFGAGNWVKMSSLKDQFLSVDPSFDEGAWGFNTFGELVKNHPSLLTRFQENISDYIVRLPGGDGATPEGTLHDAAQALHTHLRKRSMRHVGLELQDQVLRALHGALKGQPRMSRAELLTAVMEGELRPLCEDQTLTRTRIGGVLQVVFAARCFDLVPGENNAPMTMGLRADYEDVDLLRRAHDVQLLRQAQIAGLTLAPIEWGQLLLTQPHHAALQELADEASSLDDGGEISEPGV